jgi:hypothetical protein
MSCARAVRERHEHLSLLKSPSQPSRMIGLASFQLNRVAYIETLSNGPGNLVTKPFILKCWKSATSAATDFPPDNAPS